MVDVTEPVEFPEGGGTKPVPRLGQILAFTGGGMLERYPGQGDPVVHGVSILDLLEPVYPSGHIVLAVGLDPLSPEAMRVVREAGRSRVAAVVFRKDPAGFSPELTATAAAVGTVVLARTPWVDWAQLVGALRACLAGASVPLEPAFSGIALGNLEALADAIGVQVGGAVTIEDLQSRVLAYSSSGHEVDDIRKLTILGRRVPQWRIQAMEESGFFRALWGSGDVVHRRASDDEPERMAIAVKAGTEILGSIWVAMTEPFSSERAESLRSFAVAAVPHLLFYRSLHSGLAFQVEAAARDLLEGNGSAELLAERAGIPATLPAVVMAIRFDAATRTDIDPRLLELVTLKSSLQGCSPVVVTREGGILVILGGFHTVAEAPVRAKIIAESLVEPLHALLSKRPWISIGTASATLHGVPDSLRSADLALRALKFSRSRPVVGYTAELGTEMALVELSDSIAGTNLPTQTPVDLLAKYDGERGDTAMVDTLRAYLDAFGNIPAAARQLGYHPNSFRYRLRKVEEIGGIGLDDPDARLLAEIQLRLLPPTSQARRETWD